MIKKWVVARRIIQCVSLGLFVYILWSTTYPLKGLFSPDILFNLDPLIIFFTALTQKIFLSGLVYSSILLIMTLFLGRFFCGWICPLGTLMDWVSVLKSKKAILKDKTNQRLRKIKMVLLGLIGLLALFGYQAAWILDPIVTAARFISLNLIPTFTLGLNQIFIFVIKRYELYDSAVYDFYRMLKNTVLGVHPYYFDHSIIIFMFFLSIIAPSFFISRFWCRALCPLGALYNLFSRPALLERQARKCVGCDLCATKCRMGAIHRNMKYTKAECILCMDCVYECPKKITKFGFKWLRDIGAKKKEVLEDGITRKQFNALLIAMIPALGLNRWNLKGGKRVNHILRPPGSLREKDFLDRCVRCGNCMKVCPTNGLQPIMFEIGLEGIWTPKLVPEIGYCEYNCNLCGQVCPTEAIPDLILQEKQKRKIGMAEIDQSICLAWSQNSECLVCEEHCPIDQKAINIVERMVEGRRILNPVVEPKWCIGCGLCENVCPVRPVRAIRVYSERGE